MELPFAVVEDLARSALPMVTLKQIRTPGGLGADHQAILETPVSLRRLRAVQLLDPYDLQVTPHLAGFPLGKDLGLQSQRALLSFKVELDFTIGNGRTIWRAEEPASPGCLGRLLGLGARKKK
jgi:hypothetical protein